LMVDSFKKNNKTDKEANTKTSKTAKRSTETDSYPSNESSDSLQIYLRQINNIPLLEQDKQKLLIAEIDKATVALRREIYQLGFILPEHSRILDRIHDKNTNLSYDFLASSMEDQKNAILQIPAWHQEIKDLYKQLHDAYINKAENQRALRAKAVECLLKYEVVYDRLQEWYKVTLEYLTLAAPDLRKPERATFKNIPSEKVSYLEEKFLMPLEDFFPLLKKIQKKYDHLKILHKKMLEGNLRLAISIAHKYRNKGLPISDLIQEANIGLMRALEKFDFRLGNRFSTYATWWIKQTVSRAISEQSRVIRIPVHMVNTIISMNHVEQIFMQTHGREPNVKELATALEIPTSRISAIRKMARQAISLQAPIGDSEKGSVLQDILASDNSGDDPIQNISQEVLKEKVYEVLATLSEREQQIIIMRFGLMGYSPMTLVKVSEHFDLTRERIRQLEIKILEKLRTPEKRKYFDGYLHS
jgi:RNA polymerase primary sigma factor